MSQSAVQEQKIPHFTIPRFTSNRLGGEDYVTIVERKFTSNAVYKFIIDEQFCADNTVMSGAFASRILEAISESDILGYLSEQLKNEMSCSKVWAEVKDKLSSSDLTMRRIVTHWSNFFSL